ncbi:hypothetical protein BJV74DRAFT_753404, partial [Russula compacta]
TTAADAPLREGIARNPLDSLITKHPKVLSTVSTVLIVMSSVELLPGFFECVSDTILAHPAMKVAGAITVATGKWIR